MTEATRNLIDAIHAAPGRAALVATGGGVSAQAALLAVPGASRTVLEAVVPYDERALVDFLARRPPGFCTAETALELATRAYERAGWLAPGEFVVGVAVTAGLATDRPRKGDHRFHAAFRSADRLVRTSLVLAKGARERTGEEQVVDAVALNLLAEALGVEQRVPVALVEGEQPERAETLLADPIEQLLRGEQSRVFVTRTGQVTLEGEKPDVLLSGAFNPVHAGHWQLAEVAGRQGKEVAFELSVVNVDKPTLAGFEVRRRLAAFAWKAPVWLARAPTFVEKARLFPGATFAVGFDTAERIVQPRYYGDDPAALNDALQAIAGQGCRFLVAGRCDEAGRFRTLNDIKLPGGCGDLFQAIPADEFHVNLSSTELRTRAAKE